MQVNKLTMRFLKDVKNRRSENTHKFYEGRLVFFDRWFGNRKLRSLKKKDIERYFKKVNHWPDKTPKAPDTQRGNITAFEQLQKWAIKKGLLKKPILDDIDKPVGRNREMLPTPEQVEAVKNISSKAFQLVYEALRRCGARPMEICQATVENWDRIERQIVITKHKTAKKTGRPRRIAVGEALEAIILESLGDRSTGHLFVTPTGLPWDVPKLSAAFRKARNELGLPKEIVLYTTRHEHGTAVFELTGSELEAANSLGHVGLGTIHKYVKIKSEKRRNNQDAIWSKPPAEQPTTEKEQQDVRAGEPDSENSLGDNRNYEGGRADRKGFEELATEL